MVEMGRITLFRSSSRGFFLPSADPTTVKSFGDWCPRGIWLVLIRPWDDGGMGGRQTDRRAGGGGGGGGDDDATDGGGASALQLPLGRRGGKVK